MQATSVLINRLGDLLAADATTLAPAMDANVVALVMGNFTPSPDLVVADLEMADFVTSTPLAAGVGTQLVGIDPATGEVVITIKEPAGGWRWETTGLTNLPQTIYGAALLNDDSTVLYGTMLLPVPLTLTIVNQEINLGTIQFRIVSNPLN